MERDCFYSPFFCAYRRNVQAKPLRNLVAEPFNKIVENEVQGKYKIGIYEYKSQSS